MASKYDTNPLDRDFPKKAAHSAEPQRVVPLGHQSNAGGAETRNFAGGEEPTRRYEQANFAGYEAAYQHPTGGGNMYQPLQGAPKAAPLVEPPSGRKVEGVGIPENVLMVLPYAPFYIGMVASILELIFVPQSETKVRFHAAQGLALHLAILAVTMLLKMAGNISSWANTGMAIFGIVSMILLIVTMVKVWRGKPVHFEPIDSLTNWISDKIESQSK